MHATTSAKVSLFFIASIACTAACEESLQSTDLFTKKSQGVAIFDSVVAKARISIAPNPIEPQALIHDNRPTFSWDPVPNATHYRVYIRDSQTMSGRPRIDTWIASTSAGCAGGIGTCAKISHLTLADGTAMWWVLAYNSSGSGPWSSRADFVVNSHIQPPVTPSQLAPSSIIDTDRPTFEWSPVDNALWYRVFAVGPDTYASSVVSSWVKADNAGCADGSSTCRWTTTTRFENGAAKWWICAWNANGYSAWSGPLQFSVDVHSSRPPPPRQIAPIDQVTSSRPTFQWEPIDSVRGYRISVVDSRTTRNDPLIRRLYISEEDAGCAQGTGTCSFTPDQDLADGAASWTVLAWREQSGEGDSSPYADFWVNHRPVPPDPPTPIAPSFEIYEKRPVFTWSAVSNVTSYRIYVVDHETDDGRPRINRTIQPADAGCESEAGNCSWRSNVDLADGDARWFVMATNEHGNSRWSDANSFSVSTAQPQTNNALFVDLTGLPEDLVTGQSFDVAITVMNTGTTTWAENGNHRLGSENPKDNSRWGTGRVWITEEVPPSASYTFNLTLQAPDSPGIYNFQWQMVEEHVEWFGEISANMQIRVTHPIVFGVYTGTGSGLPHPTAAADDSNLLQVEIDDFMSAGYVNKKPASYGAEFSWYKAERLHDPNYFAFEDYELPFLQRARSMGMIPMVMWLAWPAQGTGNVQTPEQLDSWKKYSLPNIARGDFDDYIRYWVRGMKDYGHPVYVRLFHEGNSERVVCPIPDSGLDHPPHCSTYAGTPWKAKLSYGYEVINTPADQIAAWRRIVNISRDEGADNIIWVWSLLAWASFNYGHNNGVAMAEIYPGDDYVDWIGYSLYEFDRPSQTSYRQYDELFANVYQETEDLGANRPYMFAEIGAQDDRRNLSTGKSEWIKRAFDLSSPNAFPYRFPKVRAFYWWNDTRNPIGGDPTVHLAVHSAPQSLIEFRIQMQYPQYVSDADENDLVLLYGGRSP